MFTYRYGANPRIDYVRMLIGDTVCEGHIFEDSEIESAYAIQAAQFQSSMLYDNLQSPGLPATPVSYLRVAALLMDSLASNRTRLMGVTKLLDVTLSDSLSVARGLRDQANQWREVEDNSGAFVIVEQCHTIGGFLQRFYSQIQRR